MHLELLSVCAAAGVACRMFTRELKLWDYEDWFPEEVEGVVNYNAMRKEKPHIWIE
jgi:hypothetical protein